MKTIIAGSRSLGIEAVRDLMSHVDWPVTEVVCGCAQGVDRAGEEWAREHSATVSFWPAWHFQLEWAQHVVLPGEMIHYHPDWYNAGKGNGFLRNTRMGAYAEAAAVAWDGESHGTEHMIRVARDRCLNLLIWTPVGIIR